MTGDADRDPAAGTSPLEVMKYCYYVYALLIAACVTIQLGTHEGK